MRSTIVAVVCVGALAVGALSAQQPAWEGVYSETQAKLGEPLYAANCAACHGLELGTSKAPAIVGPAFTARWQRRGIQDLFDYVQSAMPYNNPGGMARTANANIIAFMLKQSHVPAGPKDFVPTATVGESSSARGLPFYTEDQALRGKFAFDRHCARCHSTQKHVQTLEALNAPHTPKALGATYAMSFGAPFLDRVYYGKPVFPSVYYLYDKLRNMPAFDTHSISPETRTDIIAHILKMNDFPAGTEELRPEPEAMKQMMLQERGFERIFNGKDLAGIKVVVGPDCEPSPKGCGKTDPGAALHVENGHLVCACNIHGYWYSEKKYQDFDFRFEFRFIKPADWSDSDDDELYFGGGGALIFIHDDYRVWPTSLEVELRWHDLGDIFPLTQKAKVNFTYDHAAKVRAGRLPWQWNEMRIVSKGQRVDSYLNGVLVSTITEHDFPAGQIGFQLEGAATEWRNVRVKAE